ncbi:MAG: four helix bundle protein [Phycisphaerales bacterium]
MASTGGGGFRDLIAWRKSYELGLELYRVTGRFPDSERYGLTSQLRRGGVSVSSNIAEGYGRGGRADYVRFLKIARGSLHEIDTQAQLAFDLGFADQPSYTKLREMIDECQRIVAGLIRSLDPDNAL